jgi:hypothetical protein
MLRVTLNSRQKLLCILLFAIFLRAMFFHGFFPSDPFTYSFGAYELSEGKWMSACDSSIASRWGIIFPTAFFYRLFGVNEVTSTLWPMLCSLGGIIVAYFFGKFLQDENGGLLAALLIAVFPLDVIYATQLKADVPLGFYLLITFYFFIRGEQCKSGHKKRYRFLISGIAFGMAHATKTVAMPIVLPFFLLYMIIRRRIEYQMIWVILGLILVLGVEYLIFSINVHDGLLRYHIMLQNQTIRTSEAFSHSILDATSVTAYLYWMFVDIHYVGISFYILIFASVYGIVNYFRNDERPGFKNWPIAVWSGTIFLCLTFLPMNIKPYVPLFKQVNYMLMFTTPLLIFTALLINGLPKPVKYICITLIVLSAIPCIYLSRESHRSHVDNSRAIYEFYKQHGDRPLFATSFNREYLIYKDRFKNIADYRSFNVTDRSQQDDELNNSIHWNSAYIAVDQYYLDYYGCFGYRFPPEVFNPPPSWQVLYTFQRKPAHLRVFFTNLSDMLYQKGIISLETNKRISQKLQSWSHSKPLMVYVCNK